MVASYLLLGSCGARWRGTRFSLPGNISMDEQRTRILLVEEDPTLLELTSFRLELLGYEVVEMESAEDALAWLKNELPDLLIVNQFLPGLDGVELVDRLSNDIRTADVPMMLLSAIADLDSVQRAFNAGADEYLVTPYDPAVLEEKVERLAATT
jgi:CheY-like chemotaxis protein